MCLYIEAGRKPKIAQEDIYTLKYIRVETHFNRLRFSAPVRNTAWFLKTKVKPVRLEVINNYYNDSYKINAGYYSYNVNKIHEEQDNMYYGYGNLLTGREIFLCKIPKGSTYYEDMNNAQVCSSRLELLELVYSTKGYKNPLMKKLLKDHIDVSRMSQKQRLRYVKNMIKSYGLNTQL